MRFSPNEDFDYEIKGVLGHAFAGAADVGEVLAAVEHVDRHDHDGWFAAWLALGDRVRAIADASSGPSAASALLRASDYYAAAVNAAASLADDAHLEPTFRTHRNAWDAWVDAVDLDIERVSIPYEHTALPGYVFRPRGASGRLPMLIGVNGSDGALSAMWASCISGGLARGYAVLVFDGPGQQSMLFEHHTVFRPDWEAVLSPVVDAMLARPDVDPERVAVYGISQAGYWVSRALAFEHRLRAAIVDPGVMDVSTSWTSHLPGSMVGLLDAGESAKFDRDMAVAMHFSKDLARTWAFRARPYGTAGYADTYEAVRAYRLSPDDAARIRTPLAITAPEGEQFWPGQSQQLADATAAVSTLIPFTAAEGADLHCQPLARALTEQRMFDWLDARLA